MFLINLQAGESSEYLSNEVIDLIGLDFYDQYKGLKEAIEKKW